MAEGTLMPRMDEAIRAQKKTTDKQSETIARLADMLETQARTMEELKLVVTSMAVKMEHPNNKQLSVQDEPASLAAREVKYPDYYIEFMQRMEAIDCKYGDIDCQFEERMTAIDRKYEKLASIKKEDELNESVVGEQSDENSDGDLQIEPENRKDDLLTTENENSIFPTSQASQDTALGYVGGFGSVEMRGRSYTPSPPPKGYGRRGQSSSPRARYGCSRVRDLLTSLLARNLRRDCWLFLRCCSH